MRRTIDAVKNAEPIVDFLEKRGHKLIRSGANRWKMLCPFHDEKTPSCIVSETYQSYHCFGCGVNGDIFTYMTEKEGIPFMDAVESLAAKNNIPFSRDEESKGTSRRVLMEITNLVYKAFKSQFNALPLDHPAKRNISDRSIEPDNEHNHDLFGWAGPDDTLIVKALNSKGYTNDQLIEAGVARNDRNGTCRMAWRNRLMFVIKDMAGRPVGFTGRLVYKDSKDQRKYVNSPESAIFHKSNVMFCEDIAKTKAAKDSLVYVVEGQFDAIALQHIGLTNVVASSGTALTDKHADMLKRMVGGEGRIVFAFDSDDAGQKAAIRTFKAVPAVQLISYASITHGDKDASDMYRDDPESLHHQMTTMKPLYRHVIDAIANRMDMSDEHGRNSFIKECMGVYETITDPIMADNFITYMGLLSGIDTSSIRAVSSSSERDEESRGIIIDEMEDITPEDYILSLSYEQGGDMVQRLKDIPMSGWHDKARLAMINGDGLPPQIVERFARVHEDMRAFEIFSPMVDVDELFDAQRRIIISNAQRSDIISWHQNHIGSIDERTLPSNTRMYTDQLMSDIQRYHGKES